jgi:hypothetical protein
MRFRGGERRLSQALLTDGGKSGKSVRFACGMASFRNKRPIGI